MVLLINDARVVMKDRYDKANWHYNSSAGNIEMFDIEPYLRSLGIERTDVVYCTPDQSINISLYLADQKGFTDFGSMSLSLEQKIAKMKEYKVEFVILGSRKDYKDVENIDELLGEKVGQTGSTEIFRLIY